MPPLLGQYRAGEIDAELDRRHRGCGSRTTAGTCAVMGTASTMAASPKRGHVAAGTAAIPPSTPADRLRAPKRPAAGPPSAADASAEAQPDHHARSRRKRPAGAAGAWRFDQRVILWRRLPCGAASALPAELAERAFDTTPVLVNLKRSRALHGGLLLRGRLGAVLRELRPRSIRLHDGGRRNDTASGWAAMKGRSTATSSRQRSGAARAQGGSSRCFRALAPRGAILKRSAADKSLFEREGRAVGFTSLEDLAARVDDPELDITADDFMVLQNAGPTSAACMPEAGYLPIPRKLSSKGVKDMVRISDARMSGTAFGTIVLHVAPEAASGGPLALVRDGDASACSEGRRSTCWWTKPNSPRAARQRRPPGAIRQACAAMTGFTPASAASRRGLRLRLYEAGRRGRDRIAYRTVDVRTCVRV